MKQLQQRPFKTQILHQLNVKPSINLARVIVAPLDKLQFELFLVVCSELHLSATWPSLSEEMIVENDVYS